MPLNKNKNKPTPEQTLKGLQQDQRSKDRLQLWYPKRRVLSFACGDGYRAVYVDSKRKLSAASVAFRTKLSRNVAISYHEDSSVPIPGTQVYKKSESILRSYVHFDDSRLYTLVSLWTIGTYFYSMFGHYGYLFAYSKQKRSGKTRLQDVLSHLAFEASSPQNASTPPTIREMAAEGGTVQLDTLERWSEKNTESYALAMDILDAGFRNGGQVTKMVPVGGNWKKENFPVFAPYVLTGIHRDSLSDTALDRSFAIEMKRKPIRVTMKTYNSHKCERECSVVRGRYYRWALTNAEPVSRIYESPELGADIEGLHLNDRAADIWMPIFAVASGIGIGKTYKQWLDLTSLATEMGGDPDHAEEVRQLSIVRTLLTLATPDGRLIGMTSELVKQLQDASIQIRDIELTKLLGGGVFVHKDIRLSQGPRRAWELEADKLAEVEKQFTAGSVHTP
jgi:hypothetical protein